MWADGGLERLKCDAAPSEAGDVLTHEQSAGRLLAVLEEATGIAGTSYPGSGTTFPSGRPLLSGADVKFPGKQIVAIERVSMWLDGETVCLSTWPGELQAQYKRVYSYPEKVERLIALGAEDGWQLNANFHLAYRFAKPHQRWYPGRQLTGPMYVRQWIDDYRDGRAGGRSREQIDYPSFRTWLVGRGYARPDELGTLDEWLNELSAGIQFHIRPGAEIMRMWVTADALAPERTTKFAGDVRTAIDRMLAALGEPRLGALRNSTG
jgi:hypothetical protein